MPVRQLNRQRSTEHDVLVTELVSEWKSPNSNRAEPVILEEPGLGGKVAHVYVVWSKWEQIDRVERSEIIMDAAEKRFPPGDVLNITIAMGLTPDEASRMSLKYK